MSRRTKILRKQAELANQQREDMLDSVLMFSDKRFKKFDEIILKLYLGEDLSTFFADRRVAKVYDCFSKFPFESCAGTRATIKNVFTHVHRHSKLMSGEEYINVVFKAAMEKANWYRDIFEWKPVSRRSNDQLFELLDFLFCKYEVPGFLYKAFLRDESGLFIRWFIQLGKGGSLGELRYMPVPLTRKMQHFFLNAPSMFTIEEALRWAQVKGLGGADELANRFAYSWIARKPFGDEAFWQSFIQLVIRDNNIACYGLTEIIDYVRECRRVDDRYSLKGRTIQSLTRQAEEWHDNMQHAKGNQSWEPSGLEEWKIERKEELIVMQELTGSKLLAEEGKAMKHCVSTYAYQCVAGKTAIFSMRKYLQDAWIDTMATVEVNLSLRRIVQAKARMNRKISGEAKKYLDQWADQNKLTMTPYL